MRYPGWIPVIIGLLIAGSGLVWLVGPKLPSLGQLPGDIRIQRQNFQVYLPLTTCLVLSLLLTGFMWLVRYLFQQP